MGMLITFIPWFIFWILASFGRVGLAAICGFLALGVIIVKNRIKKRSVKSLQVGTFSFFILIALLVLVFGKEAIASNIDLLGNSAIPIIILITIILKRPFSLDFLREKVGDSFGKEGGFIRANYLISSSWLILLLFNLTLVVLRHYSILHIDRGLSIAIRVLDCIIAIKLTYMYLRKKKYIPA